MKDFYSLENIEILEKMEKIAGKWLISKLCEQDCFTKTKGRANMSAMSRSVHLNLKELFLLLKEEIKDMEP